LRVTSNPNKKLTSTSNAAVLAKSTVNYILPEDSGLLP
jgi:hypothetical protein